MPTTPGPQESTAILATALAAAGLDPWVLFAGLVGGLWSLGYIPEPLAWYRRLWLAVLAALIGAWSANWGAAPLAALFAHWWAWWPPEAGGRGTAIMISLVVGLLAHRYIGPALMKKAQEVAL
jgi:hypothetical protein